MKQTSSSNMEEKLVNAKDSKKESSEFEFVTKEGSADISFESAEYFEIDEKKFTKMTARFRMGQRYGNQTFHATYWKPGTDLSLKPGSINALVFISHGYAGYLGDEYDDIARKLISQIGSGCLVFGHDHLGHGRTTAPSPEERVFATDMEEYTNPIVGHVTAVQNLVKDVTSQPVFLLGHSMGGLISIFTILSRPNMFKGFIGISPLIKMHPDNSKAPLVLLTKAIQRYWPRFTFPRFFTGIDAKKITRRKTFVDMVRFDRLQYRGGIKARTAWFMFQSCERVQKGLMELKLPMLILQGGSDRLVDPKGSRRLVESSLSIDKEIQNYPEAFHNLLVELDDVKLDVEKRTVNWINKRLDKKVAGIMQ